MRMYIIKYVAIIGGDHAISSKYFRPFGRAAGSVKALSRKSHRNINILRIKVVHALHGPYLFVNFE